MGIVSGYAGSFIPAVSMSIANGAQSSSAIDLKGFVLAGIKLPAVFTGTALTFEVSDAIDGTFQPLYDASNALVSMTVAQGRWYAVDPANFQGVQFLKIKSGSAEGGARTLTVSLRG